MQLLLTDGRTSEPLIAHPTMNVIEILLINLAVVFGAMIALWLISIALRNASIVDVFWGTGFVAIAWSTYFAHGQTSSRSMLVLVLTTIWGLRLSGYLAWRNFGKGEDFRYRAMREKVGRSFPIASLVVVFGLQGIIMWIVSVPIQLTPHGTAPIGWIDLLGVALWLIGWLFESIGDWQLARFKANPDNRSKVLDRGLWRYTRHPNYFGDFMVWWGLFVIAVAAGAPWTIFSPIIMSFLLMRVSGVTLLERSLKTTKSGYEEYVARTSSFFPMPRKQG